MPSRLRRAASSAPATGRIVAAKRSKWPRAAQPQVDERARCARDAARRPRAGPGAVRPAAPFDAAQVSTANSTAEHRGVEHPLDEHVPRISRRRAVVRWPSSPILQQLAAARRQHVVAHVADERQAERVAPPVRNAREAHDQVPAPAAQREVQRDHEPAPGPARRSRRRVGQLRRILPGDPPATAASETSDDRARRRPPVLSAASSCRRGTLQRPPLCGAAA